MADFYDDEKFYISDETIEDIKELSNPIGYGLREFNMWDGFGSTKSSTGTERLVQSMRNIIETKWCSRFMLPEFGSKVHTLIFEPNDDILRSLLKQYIKDAIDEQEPRVRITSVEVVALDDRAEAEVFFESRESSSRYSFVYTMNRGLKEMR